MKKSKRLWRKLAWMALQAERDNAFESPIHSNLENADPELCIELLKHSSVHNYLGIRMKIKNSDADWLQVSA